MKTDDVIAKVVDISKYHGGLLKLSKEADIKYHWLIALSSGRIKDPSSRRIDTLRDYFAAKDKAA